MATFRRATHGTTYFFTVVSYNRRAILCDTPIRDALRQAIITTATRFPFTIDAWVLMPDHLHAIWTLPADDVDYSRRWALIKRFVSKQCGGLYQDNEQLSASSIAKRESNIWQRRFWEHVIRDDNDFEQHMNYLHYNPIKHGLVNSLTDWEYSTFHRYVANGVYPLNWGNTELNFNNDFGE